MERRQYLVKNTILFAANNFGTKLITFFLVPIYTATLTTENYGIADLVTTISTIVVPIFTLNIGEAVMRFSLDKDVDKDSIMSVGLRYLIVGIILSLSIIPLINRIALLESYSYDITLYCISIEIFTFMVCYLRGSEKIVQYAVCNIIQVFSSSVLNIFFLVFCNMGIKGYFWGYIIGYLLGDFYAIFAGKLKYVIKQYNYDPLLAKKMIRYSIVLVPTSFMWWITNSSDRIMVSSMVGVEANGIYAVAYKIPTIVSVLATVFNQAWSYSAIKEDKSDDREKFNNVMYDRIVAFQLILTSGLLLIICPFSAIYLSKEYTLSWKYTPYLLFGNFFMSVGTFLSTSYTVNKDSKGFLVSGATGAVINIILNAIFIPIIEVYGAALATCVSYISVFIYRAIDTRKYLKLRLIKMDYIVCVGIMVIMCFMLYSSLRYKYLVLLCLFGIVVILERRILCDIFYLFRRFLLKEK